MPVHRCLYEELGIPQSADDAQIKRAYRAAALASHPDKNRGQNETEAAERFKAVQHAYEVLSDPHERAWYDSHRDAILRGRDPASTQPGQRQQPLSPDQATEVDLFAYFTSLAYTGFGIHSNSFYSVYSNVFSTLATEEYAAGFTDITYGTFGNGQSNWTSVRDFYRDWSAFSSRKTFAFADKWNLADAPNRDYRRVMDRENKRERAKAKKDFNALVRELVSFVKKRDPRVQARKEFEQQAKVQRDNLEKERQQQLHALKQAQAADLRAMREQALEQDAPALDQILEQLAIDERIEQGVHVSAKVYSSHHSSTETDSDALSSDCEHPGDVIPRQRQSDGNPNADHAAGDQDGIEDGQADENRDAREQQDIAQRHGTVGDHSDPGTRQQDLFCPACRKKFRTVPQMDNHLQSKKHIAAAAKLRSQLAAEDAQFSSMSTSRQDRNSLDFDATTNHGNQAENLISGRKTRRQRREQKFALESINAGVVHSASSSDEQSDESERVRPAYAAAGDEMMECDAAVSAIARNTVQDVDATSAQNKASKRQQRRQKRRDRVNTASNDDSAVILRCNVCGATFSSRNKLFAHVRETNHALHVGTTHGKGSRR